MKHYQYTHTCKTGFCTHCNRDFKVIRDHKCPVNRVSNVLPIDLWRELMIKVDSPTAICDGCGAQHFLTKMVDGFRRYKNVDLRVYCYRIPQIELATSTKWARLAIMDIQMGKTVCAICTVVLLDSGGHTISAFRREYVDVLETQSTVYRLHTGSERQIS